MHMTITATHDRFHIASVEAIVGCTTITGAVIEKVNAKSVVLREGNVTARVTEAPAVDAHEAIYRGWVPEPLHAQRLRAAWASHATHEMRRVLAAMGLPFAGVVVRVAVDTEHAEPLPFDPNTQVVL